MILAAALLLTLAQDGGLPADAEVTAADERVRAAFVASTVGVPEAQARLKFILDGGAPDDAVTVHQAVIDEQLPDGGIGRRLVVSHGCWLSEAYCEGYAGELADNRAQNAYFRAHATDSPYLWILGAAGAGVLIGGTTVKVWDLFHP